MMTHGGSVSSNKHDKSHHLEKLGQTMTGPHCDSNSNTSGQAASTHNNNNFFSVNVNMNLNLNLCMGSTGESKGTKDKPPQKKAKSTSKK